MIERHQQKWPIKCLQCEQSNVKIILHILHIVKTQWWHVPEKPLIPDIKDDLWYVSQEYQPAPPLLMLPYIGFVLQNPFGVILHLATKWEV